MESSSLQIPQFGDSLNVSLDGLLQTDALDHVLLTGSNLRLRKTKNSGDDAQPLRST
jgi:hypothetical protein